MHGTLEAEPLKQRLENRVVLGVQLSFNLLSHSVTLAKQFNLLALWHKTKLGRWTAARSHVGRVAAPQPPSACQRNPRASSTLMCVCPCQQWSNLEEDLLFEGICQALLSYFLSLQCFFSRLLHCQTELWTPRKKEIIQGKKRSVSTARPFHDSKFSKLGNQKAYLRGN